MLGQLGDVCEYVAEPPEVLDLLVMGPILFSLECCLEIVYYLHNHIVVHYCWLCDVFVQELHGVTHKKILFFLNIASKRAIVP